MAKNVGRVKKRQGPEPYSVLDAVQEYLASSQVKRLQPKTQKEYRERLGIFSNWCAAAQEQILLCQINSKIIDLFVEHLRKTHKPCKPGASELSSYTLAGYVRVIHGFLNWCLDDEQFCSQVQATMIQRIKKPKVEETVLDTFDNDEIDALFKACDREESEHLQLRDKAILAVLLDTGIRANELVTLTMGHVDLNPKDAHIRVLGKGRKWGEVGLGEQARRTVAKYIRDFRIPTIKHEIEQQTKNVSPRQREQITKQFQQHSLLFVGRSGDRLTPGGLYRMICRLGRWAGIEGVRCSPHTFRHTFSVNFIRQGGDIYKLSKLLRHSSVSVTENYLKSIRQTEARRGQKSVLDNL